MLRASLRVLRGRYGETRLLLLLIGAEALILLVVLIVVCGWLAIF